MSIENAYNQEAKDKIKELAEGIDFNMMITNLDERPPHTQPMSTKKVDEDGKIWFLSSLKNEHLTNLKVNNDVHLLYIKPNSMEFLSVFGKADIVNDKSIFEELYQSTDDTWFEGVDDPNLRAISVSPSVAKYWEPKSNKAVTLLKMAYGAITGNHADISKEGELKP